MGNVLDKLDDNGLIAVAWLATAVGSVTLALRNADKLPLLKGVFSNPVTPLVDALGSAGFETLTLLFLVAGVVSLADDTGVIDA